MKLSSKQKIKGRITATAVQGLFSGLSAASRMQKVVTPQRYNVDVIKDIPYRNSGQQDHLLDLYRPNSFPEPRPIVIYFHGGGFRILSKESHWALALLFARRGYLVFNVEYRRGADNPYPAAVNDAFDAYTWVVKNAESLGGDPRRIVVAGESAGANLSLNIAIASTWRLEHVGASAVYDAKYQPKVVLPACGLFQMTDMERFHRQFHLSTWLSEYFELIERSYLEKALPEDLGGPAFCDPLVMLESLQKPQRSLPKFYLCAGTSDPILDDTIRANAALKRLGADVHCEYYENESHAFHALLWKSAARECWSKMLGFTHNALATFEERPTAANQIQDSQPA